MMYTLYEERWYLDSSVTNKHVCEKHEHMSLKEAQDEMNSAYEALAHGNCSSLLLDRSFIIVFYGRNGLCNRMIQYGILSED